MRANRPVTVSQAAGFPFDTWEGVHHRVAEADLRYFADATHNTTDGEPLVLVQCKAGCRCGPGQELRLLDQARLLHNDRWRLPDRL